MEARATARAVSIRPRGSTSTATTRSTASGAVRRAMVLVAFTPPRASTATAPAATSVSGAAPPPTALAASTARPASTRSEKVCMAREGFNALMADGEPHISNVN